MIPKTKTALQNSGKKFVFLKKDISLQSQFGSGWESRWTLIH